MLDQSIIPTLMHAGGFLVLLTMVTLALFSVYSLAVIGERWWTFRRCRRTSTGLLRRVLEDVDRGKLRAALLTCAAGKGGPLAPVLAAGVDELVPLASENPGLHAGGQDRGQVT